MGEKITLSGRLEGKFPFCTADGSLEDCVSPHTGCSNRVQGLLLSALDSFLKRFILSVSIL